MGATGDMGIGNTTPSSAITSAITGVDPGKSTGRGTGITKPALSHKVSVVRRALSMNRPDPRDGIDVLAKVGGYEIGLLAGVILGGAAARRPVVVDGFISGAAALIACAVAPSARPYLIASHTSVEPGHKAALAHLKLRPPPQPEDAPGGGSRGGPGNEHRRGRRQMPGPDGDLRRSRGVRVRRSIVRRTP